MTFASTHGQSKTLPKFNCSAIPTCKVQFLDTQITGAAFMLQRTIGYIPPTKHDVSHNDPESARLSSLVTHGGIVADTMGLGKTFLALLFINYLALYGQPCQHKPTLILAPNGVVLNQWLEAIYRSFPDLAILLVHGERPSSVKFAAG